MSDDILNNMRIRASNPHMEISDVIYNEALILIEDKCLMLTNKVLTQLGMSSPNRPMHDAFNQDLKRETHYNVEALRDILQKDVPLMNQQQKYVYNTIMQVVNDGTGGIFFLDAPGGTGKNVLDIIDFGNNSIATWNCSCPCLFRNSSYIVGRRANSSFGTEVAIKHATE